MESNTNPIPGVQQRGDQRFWALAGTPASSELQLLHLSLPPFVVSPLSAFPLPTPLSARLAARCTLLDVPSLPPWGYPAERGLPPHPMQCPGPHSHPVLWPPHTDTRQCSHAPALLALPRDLLSMPWFFLPVHTLIPLCLPVRHLFTSLPLLAPHWLLSRGFICCLRKTSFSLP